MTENGVAHELEKILLEIVLSLTSERHVLFYVIFEEWLLFEHQNSVNFLQLVSLRYGKFQIFNVYGIILLIFQSAHEFFSLLPGAVC